MGTITTPIYQRTRERIGYSILKTVVLAIGECHLIRAVALG